MTDKVYTTEDQKFNNLKDPFSEREEDKSPFLKLFKPAIAHNHKFKPWGYVQSTQDPDLFHPDLYAHRLVEYACKRVYAGVNYESAAIWISKNTRREHASNLLSEEQRNKIPEDGYQLTIQTFRKMYKKYLQAKGLQLRATKVKAEEQREERIREKVDGEVNSVGRTG